MVMFIDTIEKVKKIGNAYYLNIKKDIMELLQLEKDDFIKIRIERVEPEIKENNIKKEQ